MKIKFLKNIFLISGAFSLSTFLISCNTKKSQNSNDIQNNNNKELKINEFKLEINNDSLKAYITGNNLNNLDSYDFKIVNPKNEDDNDDETTEPKETVQKDLSDTEKIKIVELYTEAIENYNTYLVKQANAEDKEKVEEQVKLLNTEINKYNTTV